MTPLLGLAPSGRPYDRWFAAGRNFYYSASASHGETDSRYSLWAPYLDHFANAINATRNAAGDIVCAINAVTVTDPKCAPLNPFGSSTASAAARAYVSVKTGNEVRNKQDDFLGALGGDLFTLPAGKVNFSVAYEHRREGATFTPSQADQEGLSFGTSVPESGNYHTDEFSGELLVPLLGGDFTLPFVKALELTGSYRYVDNSLAGKESVWGAGVRWEVAYGLTLRASRSRNFSAPTLDQQFAPTSVSPGNPASDPCDQTLINSRPNPAVRLANCQKLFAAHPEYGPLSSFMDPAVNTGVVAITQGGNPDLQNEVSNTTTFGFVWKPDYVAAPVDTLPSDLTPTYRPSTTEVDYVRREAMIPMRDGVKLYTLILMKKGVVHGPILLERTPYGADASAMHGSSQQLAQRVPPADSPYVEDGYIRVWQDVRGRNKSEGTYATNRPLSGPLNPTRIDHATDTYDTLEWLTHNVPETNGNIGMIGGSYDGFTTLMGSLSGHPALKAVVPINPMVDVWMGDDWYHYGAFRQITLNVLPIIMAKKDGGAPTATGVVDLYGRMLQSGSAGDYIRRYGLDVFPAAQRFIAHPAYDSFWQGQALDKLMAAHPIRTPMLLVAGRYDEQDLYGAPAVFRALHPLDKDHKVSLLSGPWSHMGVNGDGASLGSIKFDEDTAAYARRYIIKPFLDARLKDGAAPFDPPAVISYTTGSGEWRRSDEIPSAATAFYLRAHQRLSLRPPAADEPEADAYVSDPQKPVGVLSRPFFFAGHSDSWKTSLIADQRFASQRPDVLTYETEPLDQPVHVFGQPQVDLFAATTGTDSDFVVKLIDVYPDEMSDADLGGYQLPLSMDIFRGRYRTGLDSPKPIQPGKTEAYRFPLPMADHVFAKGHRIMVQVQSSWFPVYDRNPQAYVDNIFKAKPADYQKATQSVFHDPAHASAVRLPIVTDGIGR